MADCGSVGGEAGLKLCCAQPPGGALSIETRARRQKCPTVGNANDQGMEISLSLGAPIAVPGMASSRGGVVGLVVKMRRLGSAGKMVPGALQYSSVREMGESSVP